MQDLCSCFYTQEVSDLEKELNKFNSHLYPADIYLHLGGLSDKQLLEFRTNPTLKAKYDVLGGIGMGNHWTAIRAKRKFDQRQVVIKRIVKKLIPPQERYVQPCNFTVNCKCIKCRPDIKLEHRPPLELLLLCSRSSTLPELLEYVEDDACFYLVCLLHGVSERSFKHPWTWCGPNQYAMVNWLEYFS